jgi:hypothetical protein
VDELTRKVLALFRTAREEMLDLHQLFEAGGNDPDARTRVLDVAEQLVNSGLLEERGSDFYSLTEAGKKEAGRQKAEGSRH